MVRVILDKRTLASCTGSTGYATGSNSLLTLGYTSSAAGGYYTLSGTPAPDPLKLQHLAASVFEDTRASACLGVGIEVGILSGQKDDAFVPLKCGIVGTAGDPWVRIQGVIWAPFGIGVYIPGTLISGTYVVKLMGVTCE